MTEHAATDSPTAPYALEPVRLGAILQALYISGWNAHAQTPDGDVRVLAQQESRAAMTNIGTTYSTENRREPHATRGDFRARRSSDTNGWELYWRGMPIGIVGLSAFGAWRWTWQEMEHLAAVHRVVLASEAG